MNDELLKQFFQQEHIRAEVYKFFKSVLDEIALERVYKRESTDGIADAREALSRAESALRSKFTELRPTKDPRRAE